MNKREEQKQERKQAILHSALDLFVKRGYNATKISDIAKEVNMSVGLLFHYFDSKEKLYEELIRIGLEGTKSIMKLEYNTPLEFFRVSINSIFNSMHNMFVTKMFVLMAQATMNDAAPLVVKELVAKLDTIEMTVPLIIEGQRLGEIKPGNPLALSIAFWCSIQGIAEELAFNPNTPYPDPEWIIDIIRK